GGGEGEYEDHEHYGTAEPSEQTPIETYHFQEGDLGNLALITGAAELQTSGNSEAAQQFLSFLLSRHAQEYAAQSVHEYPVVRGIPLPEYMLEEDKAFNLSPDYNYEQLQQLDGTLNLL